MKTITAVFRYQGKGPPRHRYYLGYLDEVKNIPHPSFIVGNFYTNVTLRKCERDEVIAFMRDQVRACFVSPMVSGFVTVYDRLCEEQDLRDLALLTTTLSAHFHCLALGVLNHDDDILWIGVAREGKWVTEYRSDQPYAGSAWKISTACGVLGLFPLVWLLMRWPLVLFQIWRHSALASVLGLPNFSVGFGYRYLSRGERPDNAHDFEAVS